MVQWVSRKLTKNSIILKGGTFFPDSVYFIISETK